MKNSFVENELIVHLAKHILAHNTGIVVSEIKASDWDTLVKNSPDIANAVSMAKYLLSAIAPMLDAADELATSSAVLLHKLLDNLIKTNEIVEFEENTRFAYNFFGDPAKLQPIKKDFL